MKMTTEGNKRTYICVCGSEHIAQSINLVAKKKKKKNKMILLLPKLRNMIFFRIVIRWLFNRRFKSKIEDNLGNS